MGGFQSKGYYKANTHVSKGFQLPGITDDAREALAQCLEDNHKHHHIFFNNKGFHNHLTHHLLAAFALGASADRIRAIHAYQSRRQLPMKPKHSDTASFNPEEHWGDENYYHDYLHFFNKEVLEQDGGDGRRTVERWMFEDERGKRGQFYVRCLGGAYHPFIHLGYGLEFDLNCMIAEGLAQAAVHSTLVLPVIAGDEPIPEETASKSAKEIVFEVANDRQLDHKVKWEDENKTKALLSSGGGSIIRAHAATWHCPEEKVSEKAHELQQLAIAALAGAVRPEKEVKLDFFLMHAVTSSLFLPVFAGCLPQDKAVRLLRDKLAVDLTYYVSRGRPAINLDQLLNYKSKKREFEEHENGWFGIWDAVLDLSKYTDEHVVKTIRSLSYADQHHIDIGLLKQEMYLSVAKLVVDHITSVSNWDFEGVGFEQNWKEWPDRHQVM
jgi:hypothetical protein